MKTILLATVALLIAGPVYAGNERQQPLGAPTANAGAIAGASARSASVSVSRAQGGSASSRVTVNQQGGGSGGGYNARGNTPDVLIPSVTTGNTCALPVSAGAAFSGIGFGFGAAAESKNCEIRQLAGLFLSLNMKPEAKETLCQTDVARRAFYTSGHPCVRDMKGWDR